MIPLGITDSACKDQSIMVSVQYGPFNTYIPIRSTTIGISRVARDPIAMHTSWRSKSDIACVTSIGYPRTKASGESSTTKHRLLHASGPHPIPPPNDPNRVGKRVKVRHISCRVSMTFRVVRTNQYNQYLGLIHLTNGNHLESSNEDSSIDHHVTIHLHAQNITMFPINETCAAAAARCRRKFVSGQFDEENPFVLISSALLVQPDEGVSVLVVDRIGDNLPQSTEKSRILVIPVGARHKCQQDRKNENRETTTGPPPCAAAPPQPSAHERAFHRAGRASRRGRCTLLAAPLDAPGANRCAAGRDVHAPRAAAACRGRTSSRVLRDGWPLDDARGGRGWAALSERARRWAADARCWSATLAAAGRARCALAARRCARLEEETSSFRCCDWESSCELVSPLLLAAGIFARASDWMTKTWSSNCGINSILSKYFQPFVPYPSNPRTLFSCELSGDFPSFPVVVLFVRGNVGLLLRSSSNSYQF
ncbi:hypothetical protein F511_24372 [Dorcoceras hygrometricum]|uniref:Uncharacterized protein n=1 Tax=Dorcoceras hygrometricum TaxID=472368 RepID=A0A2Z7AQH1_9LAMI|nr:hypothetical protein F511_24372 [Dorcoceras hygrometricum]